MCHMLLLQSRSNISIFLQLQEHLYIESPIGWHLFLEQKGKKERRNKLTKKVS